MLATVVFIVQFALLNVRHLPRYGSDHAALRIALYVIMDRNNEKQNKISDLRRCRQRMDDASI